MTKVRAKNLKPKIQPDFKKKKARVGKKVVKSNVTVIKVQSKHIHVPVQSQMLAKKAGSEQELVDKILKQLSHHSSHARQAALDELLTFIKASTNSQSFMSLICPQALELLFDEEKDVRKSLLNFMSFVLSSYHSSAFVAVAPIMVSYICGGLTSLLKSIRRDSLSFVATIATLHNQMMAPFAEKLLVHVIVLLEDFSLTNGYDSINSAATSSIPHSSDSRKNVLKIAGVTTSKSDGKTTAKAASSTTPITNTPLMVLKALYALLRPISADSEGVSTSSIGSAGFKIARDRVFSRMLTFGHQNSAGSFKLVSLPTVDFCSSVTDLCRRMSIMWSGWTLKSSLIKHSVVTMLTEILRVGLAIGTRLQLSSSSASSVDILGCRPEFSALVLTVFETFPYHSCDATVAVAGSEHEKSLIAEVDLLNLAVCEVVILPVVQSIEALSAVYTIGASHVLARLNVLVGDLDSVAGTSESLIIEEHSEMQALSDFSSDTESIESDSDGDSDKVDGAQESKSPAENPYEGFRRIGRKVENDSAKRIFSCVKQIVSFPRSLEAANVQANSCTQEIIVVDILLQLTEWLANQSQRGILINVLDRCYYLLEFAVEVLNTIMSETRFQTIGEYSFMFSQCGDKLLDTFANVFTILTEVIAEDRSARSDGRNDQKRQKLEESATKTPPHLESAQINRIGVAEKCVRAFLAVLQKYPNVEEGNDCDQSVATLPIAIVNKMACILRIIFGVSIDGPKSGKIGTISLFSTMLKFLDFRDIGADTMLALAKKIVRSISRENVSCDIQSKFLRCLLARRQSFSAVQFIDIAIDMLRIRILSTGSDSSALRQPTRDADAITANQITMLFSSEALSDVNKSLLLVTSVEHCWLANEVSQTLLSIASSEAPLKIVRVVYPKLKAMVETFLSSKSDDGNVPNGQSELHGLVAILTLFVVLSSLLQPLTIPRENWDQDVHTSSVEALTVGKDCETSTEEMSFVSSICEEVLQLLLTLVRTRSLTRNLMDTHLRSHASLTGTSINAYFGQSRRSSRSQSSVSVRSKYRPFSGIIPGQGQCTADISSSLASLLSQCYSIGSDAAPSACRNVAFERFLNVVEVASNTESIDSLSARIMLLRFIVQTPLLRPVVSRNAQRILVVAKHIQTQLDITSKGPEDDAVVQRCTENIAGTIEVLDL